MPGQLQYQITMVHGMKVIRRLGMTFLFGTGVFAGETGAAERIDFNRDVRPILSANCFQCHGPDGKERQADLRLDVEADAKRETDGAAAIVPGAPEKSLLVERIRSADPDELMPPPESKKDLTAAQRDILEQWIREGAEYQDHWAFRPVARPEPPAVQREAWVRNPIDRFVLRKLESKGIAPSPPAAPGVLLKRIHMDLVGVLPTPEEVARFTTEFAKDADAAVRSLVRRLLPTNAHGERWGRHWLDQARYADSHGYTIDGDRIMWPYRDWVIRAVRDDMPFDRFTIEQLAGDLLENPTKAQLVATGFHRNTLINQEGGTDNEQFRNEEVVDRVNTTGAVWLGLTVGCAQCHTHKFDPITQKEYFRMFAFFNHTEDVNNTGPTVEVSEHELFLDETDPKLLKELERANAAVRRLERNRGERQKRWEKSYLAKTDADTVPNWRALRPAKVTAERGSPLKVLADGSVLGETGHAPQEDYVVSFDTGDEPVAAFRLRVLPHASLPKRGPGLAGNGNFVLTRVEARLGDERIPIVRADADHAQPGFPIVNVIDGKTDTGWAINVGRGTAKGVKMNTEHEAQFTFAEPLKARGRRLRITLRHEKNNHYNIGRFAVDVSPTPPPNLQAGRLLAVLAVEPGKRSKDQAKLVADHFAAADAELKKARGGVDSLRKKIGLGRSVRAMITKELAKPRETYVHIRGNFLLKDRRTGKLAPDVPSVFPPLEAGEHERVKYPNRLDLARWLVHPDNPLTARVTVNRVWMRYFGRGLVETENDFGTQGTFPTHPELLDWLARYFMDQGWSLHRLHELITASATYRQASHQRPELESVDGRNLLLARQNRLRFDAEIIRDAALSASGLLADRVGGPSVRPPQPPGVYAFTQRARTWEAAKGENRFRRGLYTLFYRSAPYPMMTTFDSPDFQSVCTARPRSNTPLQSLTMANDAAFFELAQGLAVRLLSSVKGAGSPADRERIRLAYLRCFARPPSSGELAAVSDFLERQTARFTADAGARKAVAPEVTGHPPAVAAAWTAVARALINTDEFITRE